MWEIGSRLAAVVNQIDSKSLGEYLTTKYNYEDDFEEFDGVAVGAGSWSGLKCNGY